MPTEVCIDPETLLVTQAFNIVIVIALFWMLGWILYKVRKIDKKK